MIFLAVVIGLLPGLTWLLFYLHEDGKPEPILTVARVFLAGAVAAFAGLAVQLALKGQLAGDDLGIASSGHTFLFASIEEIAKFTAAFLAIRYSKAFDEPVDAIFYPVVAALGFASVENISVAHSLLSGGSIAGAFEVVTLRFIGATFIHSVASATAGFFWGHSLMRYGNSLLALVGLVAASALHGTFNLLILSYGNTVYTFAFLAGAVMLVLYDFHEIRDEERKLGLLPTLNTSRAR